MLPSHEINQDDLAPIHSLNISLLKVNSTLKNTSFETLSP